MPASRRGYQRHRRDCQNDSQRAVELPYFSYELAEVAGHLQRRHVVERMAVGVEITSHRAGAGREYSPVRPRHPRFGQAEREDEHGCFLECLAHAIEVLTRELIELGARAGAITQSWTEGIDELPIDLPNVLFRLPQVKCPVQELQQLACSVDVAIGGAE